MEAYTREKWEEIGLLSGIPEDRKDNVVNALNVAVKGMTENLGRVQNETIPIPVIMKIVRTVDVPDEDIPRLCNEILEEYNKHDFEKDKANADYMNIDYEAMFLSKFADMKIEQYKQK
jgi:hypothetical protein